MMFVLTGLEDSVHLYCPQITAEKVNLPVFLYCSFRRSYLKFSFRFTLSVPEICVRDSGGASLILVHLK